MMCISAAADHLIVWRGISPWFERSGSQFRERVGPIRMRGMADSERRGFSGRGHDSKEVC